MVGPGGGEGGDASGFPERPSSRGGVRYLVLNCPKCRRSDTTIEVTGALRRALFNHQQGVTQGRPRFNVETHGHDEAEVQCAGCGGKFWSISPIAIEDAKKYNDAVKAAREEVGP